MIELSYTVQGMSCAHCVDAITREVGAVTGVANVAVDLDRGLVTVNGHGLDDTALRAAIDEAGYVVVR